MPADREHSGISVVVPVLDDSVGLDQLMTALARQTRPADEVVIVDGGSTDGTLEVIDRWRRSGNPPITLLAARGVKIGEARNLGAEAARHDWIASTDAGCRPVPGWLAAIDAARDRADFVAGVAIVEGETPLQRVLAVTHYPTADELEQPPMWVRISHRLFGRGHDPNRVGGGYMAFAKKAWNTVGGFPEHVYASEDRGFSTTMVNRGFRVIRAPDAAVRWCPPATWRQNARMFQAYARGDIRFPGRARHFARASAWATAVLLSTVGGRRTRAGVAAGALAYIALPLRRARLAGVSANEWWRIPLVVALKDISQIVGAVHGIVDAARGIGQPAPHAITQEDPADRDAHEQAA